MHVSERRACAALGKHRSRQRKVPRGREDKSGSLPTPSTGPAIRPLWLSQDRRVARAGVLVNHKRVERIWRREGLKEQAFRERWLGRYIEKHHSSFFVALDADGRAIGYLAGCLENPTTLSHFNDVAYFRSIEDICRDYPAHLYVNVAERYRIVDWKLPSLGDLLSGPSCIRSRESTL